VTENKTMPFDDHNKHFATHLGTKFAVYTKGSGPQVVVLPEAPGLHKEVFSLSDRLVEAGFSVHLLSLFGEDGTKFRYRDVPRCLLRACIRKEFSVFAQHRSSPLTDWVRAYCRTLHQHNQKGIGLIGMCLTGNFALSLLAEPWMLAPVLCQPSLPFLSKKGLHVEPEILNKAKKNKDLKVLGMRFTNDFMCPKERFQQLRKELPSQISTIEIDSSWGNANKIRPIAHSVLTKDFVDHNGHPTQKALKQTILFLHTQLKKSS
jgi:dienelactone hydrolase